MSITLRLCAFIACGLWVSGIWAEDSRTIRSKGGISLGGVFQFPIEYSNQRTWRFDLQIDPKVGYFVIDGLELRAGIKLRTPTGLPSEAPNFRWGGSVGVGYYFDTESNLFPHIGLDFGVENNNATLQQNTWIVEAPIGLLIALNSFIALDVGLNIRYEGTVLTFLDSIRFTPGYLGLKAVF